MDITLRKCKKVPAQDEQDDCFNGTDCMLLFGEKKELPIPETSFFPGAKSASRDGLVQRHLFQNQLSNIPASCSAIEMEARIAEGACHKTPDFVEFSGEGQTYTKTAAKVNFFLSDAELEKLPHLTEYSMRRGRPGFVYSEKQLTQAAESKFGAQVFYQKRAKQSAKIKEKEQEKEVKLISNALSREQIFEHLEAALRAGLSGGKAGRTKFSKLNCGPLCEAIQQYLEQVDACLLEKNITHAKLLVEAVTSFAYQRYARIVKNDEGGLFRAKVASLPASWKRLATNPEMSSDMRIKVAKRLGRWGKRFNTLKDNSTSMFLNAMAEVMQQLRTCSSDRQN